MVNQIYNDDCFNVFNKINEKVDLILVDLPYGQTQCDWDIKIDLKMMWDNLNKICRDYSKMVFFCTTKFGNELINSNRDAFRYDLVWEKSTPVGFLSCNSQPLRKHEMIYIFSNNISKLENDIELKEYFKKIFNFINLKKSDITKNKGFDHCFRSTQFSIPVEKNYNKLIDLYKINEMKDFKTYNEISELTKKIYNPQMTIGKPYIKKDSISLKTNVYGNKINTATINNGERYPVSILKYNSPYHPIHNTQKPIELCEWLIKSYSNEGDLVLDFTAGSMTCAVACINTNRRFIMIEKDEEIFNLGKARLLKLDNHNIIF